MAKVPNNHNDDLTVDMNWVFHKFEELLDDHEIDNEELLNKFTRKENPLNKEIMFLLWLKDEFNCFNQIPSERAMVKAIEDGEDLVWPVVKRSSIWEICDVCGGDGSHVNPAIDCGGISQDDFYDDPDFADSYFSGAFDQQCQTCSGTGKVRVPARGEDDSFTGWVDSEHEKDVEYAYESARERAAELKWGC